MKLTDFLDQFAAAATLPSLEAAREADLVKMILARLEAGNQAWLDGLRALFARRYSGGLMEVSTDEVWELMEECGIPFPPDTSTNVLGTFFRSWERAHPVGYRRSSRAGAHGNLLRTWVVQ